MLFQAIKRPIARRLQCGDPRSMDKYIKNLESLLDHANVVYQTMNLEQIPTIPLTDDDIQIYEEMHKIITRCMIQAEKKCRKLYMGGVSFSPELVNHLTLINFWYILIRKNKSSCTNMRTIIKFQKLSELWGNCWSITSAQYTCNAKK